MPGYNQYIGMRYVPIIDGAWVNSKNYEPLVVVTYNGNSYISKSSVPAGTLPTDDTYWMLSANYNAQVEQYRQEVQQYQETVTGFEGRIGTLESKTQLIEDDLDTMNILLFHIDEPLRTSAIDPYTHEDVTGNVYDWSNHALITRWKTAYPNFTVRIRPVGFFCNCGTVYQAGATVEESGSIAGGDYVCRVTPHARIMNLFNVNTQVNANLRLLVEIG